MFAERAASLAAIDVSTSWRLGTTVSGATTDPKAVDALFDDAVMRVVLEDGRELSVPLEGFPRLRDATVDERSRWRAIGRREGLYWDDLDEDISERSLLGLPT